MKSGSLAPPALFFSLKIALAIFAKARLLCPFFFFNKFIYLFLAAFGLHCCTQAFCSGGEQGLLFIVVRRLLIAMASLVVEHRL